MFSLGYARKTFMFVGTQEEVSSLFFLCICLLISSLVCMSHGSRMRRKLWSKFKTSHRYFKQACLIYL